MKKNFLIAELIAYCLLFSFSNFLTAQAPEVKMSKAFGGSLYERSYDIKNIAGGSYIIAGAASSSNGQVSGLHGSYDAWLVTIDSTGKILKKNCVGGMADDKSFGVAIKGDGTYGVCGTVSSPEALPTRDPLYGYSDIYFFNLGKALSQLDSLHFGGSYYDEGADILRSVDSAYILLGHTASVDHDAIGNHGSEATYDIIVIKLGFVAPGFIKLIGGSANEFAKRIIQDSDGGYLILGTTNSTDGNVSGFHGGTSDAFVAKLSASGSLLWTKCYGGTGTDEINAAVQTSDGGYILVGSTTSADGDAAGNPDPFHASVWMMKINATGVVKKKKFYGGTQEEAGRDIVALGDSSYAIVSYTTSIDGDVIGHFYGDFCCSTTDAWLIDINASGDIVWQGSYGGGGSDYPTRMIVNTAGKIVIGGYTNSGSGQISGFHGNDDIWVTRLGDLICDVPRNSKITAVFSDGASLLWDLVPGALKYQYRVRPTGGSWISAETSTGSPGASVTDLSSATAYEFQVRAICQTSPLIRSDWSKKLSFTTASPAVSSFAVKNILLKPNPVRGSAAHLSYTLEKPGAISIRIISAEGWVSQVYDAGVQRAGENRFTLNSLANLKTGNYFLVVEEGRLPVAYSKFVVVH